ncbi:MAG: hypothetical protein IEMM0002_1461 [bacterium]|nr:MAG: hypothetical protein IEMM0002_1461 [bacterium]
MKYQANYPDSVLEILDDEMKFKKGTVRALKNFRRFIRKNRLRGYNDPRIILQRFYASKRLIEILSIIYRIPVPDVRLGKVSGEPASSGSSCYIPANHTIVLSGKLSVITLLHEFAHARGRNEREAVRFSVNLFKKVYPKQFNKLMEGNNNGQDSHFLSDVAES